MILGKLLIFYFQAISDHSFGIDALIAFGILIYFWQQVNYL
jgi:hypothetical protein